MIVLGIESSCDETAAALLRDGRRILSSVVASQVRIHRDYGGVVPELASREHADNVASVVELCFERSGLSWDDLTAIAATRGPGLMGSLLVGLAYAKALSYSLRIPFVGVNHLEGHLASIFLDHPDAELPALSLVVSGGHTNLYHLDEEGRAKLLARTLDDAAGEALDKLSKLVGLGYPGGPVIDRLASLGDPGVVRFSLPKVKDGSFSFSFSGLKTAALRHVRGLNLPALRPEDAEDESRIPAQVLDLAAGFQKAVVDQILDRLDRFLSGREVKSIHLSGGVSCNSELRRRARAHFDRRRIPVYFPRPELTTDNAAMIAAAAARRVRARDFDGLDISADPNLKVSGRLAV